MIEPDITGPAIVTGKNDQRILIQTVIFQCLHNTPYTTIHRPRHCGINTQAMILYV